MFPSPSSVTAAAPGALGRSFRRSSRSRSGWVVCLSFPPGSAGFAAAAGVARSFAPALPGAVAPRVRRAPAGGWLVSVPVFPSPAAVLL